MPTQLFILLPLLAVVLIVLFFILRDEKPFIQIAVIIAIVVSVGNHARDKFSEVQSRVQGMQSSRNSVAVSTRKRPPTESEKKALYKAIEEGIQEEVSANPLFLTLKKYDPNSYLRLESAMREAGNEAIRENIPTEQAIARMVEAALQMDEFGTKYLPHASDETVLAYSQVQISVWRQFLAKDTDLCFAAIWGDTKKISERASGLKSSITQGTIDALIATKAMVIESAATKPQPAPDQAFADKKLDEIIEQLTKLHGDDVQLLANVNAARTNKKKACTLMIEVFNRATRLPKKDASAVLRGMMAGK